MCSLTIDVRDNWRELAEVFVLKLSDRGGQLVLLSDVVAADLVEV